MLDGRYLHVLACTSRRLRDPKKMVSLDIAATMKAAHPISLKLAQLQRSAVRKRRNTEGERELAERQAAVSG